MYKSTPPLSRTRRRINGSPDIEALLKFSIAPQVHLLTIYARKQAKEVQGGKA
jgi:hypothetical protein